VKELEVHDDDPEPEETIQKEGGRVNALSAAL
jgi:hypothetical protein